RRRSLLSSFFEVEPRNICERTWVFMSKGGDDFPYGGVSKSLVKWTDDASEMGELNRRANGQVAQTRRASKYYFRPAISFSNRSVQFSVRWHPSNFVFSVRGPAVIPLAASQAYVLGYFNSRLVRALIQMQTASQTYTSGVLKELRWVEPDFLVNNRVEEAALNAFHAVRKGLGTVETDPCFSGLFPSERAATIRTWAEYRDWRDGAATHINEVLTRAQAEIDLQIAELYGVTEDDVERCERSDSEEELGSQRFPPAFAFTQTPGEATASFLVGVAFGRWKTRPVAYVPALDSPVPETQPSIEEA